MSIDNINYQNIYTKTHSFNNYNIIPKNNINPKNFVNYIQTALEELNNTQNVAKINSEKFILNQPGISLNDVMIDLQKSSIAMQIAIQVRNKIVTSYQEIMNQQI